MVATPADHWLRYDCSLTLCETWNEPTTCILVSSPHNFMTINPAAKDCLRRWRTPSDVAETLPAYWPHHNLHEPRALTYRVLTLPSLWLSQSTLTQLLVVIPLYHRALHSRPTRRHPSSIYITRYSLVAKFRSTSSRSAIDCSRARAELPHSDHPPIQHLAFCSCRRAERRLWPGFL